MNNIVILNISLYMLNYFLSPSWSLQGNYVLGKKRLIYFIYFTRNNHGKLICADLQNQLK